MRYIDIGLLEPNMILGRTLFGRNNDAMLMRNQRIKPDYIKHIKDLGFQGLYIRDRISDDIEFDDVVSAEVRMGAIKCLKNLFILNERNDFKKFNSTLDEMNETVDDIVTQITTNKDAIINIIDLKVYDDYTFFHSVNVAIISVAIGLGLGLKKEELSQLALAGILHDIGKQKIPYSILHKEASLTPEEFKELQRHPAYGYRIMRDYDHIPAQVYLSILQHHERFNGEGYPHGKQGLDISLFARIIGVADVYDAVISKRPYHDPVLPSDAVEYIMGGSGTLFDPEIVKIFLRKVAAYPISTCVMLSDGTPAIVVKNYEDCNTRPVVKLLKGDLNHPTYINLKNDPDATNLTITGVLNI